MTRHAMVLLLAAALLGCRSKDAVDEPAPGTPAARPSPGSHAEEAPAQGHDDDAPRVVRIEPDMLRDLKITLATVESRPGGEGTPVQGELRVNEDAYAEVGVTIPARVVRLMASPGDRVARGRPLAELQSVELGKSRGEYGEAAAHVELARRALERKRALAAERIAPQREVQEAEAELRTAEAEMNAARAALSAVGARPSGGADSSRFTITSPVTGTVIDRTAVQGQAVDPSIPLFKVADLSRLWLTAHAYERDAVRVRVGALARVVLAALPGQAFSGRVTRVGSQVEMSSRTIPIRVELTNEGGVLRPGMSATAWLPVAEGAPVLAVPAVSVQRVDDRWCVFVPKSADTFEVRPVGRGRDLGGEVEIVSGLEVGETVVADGAFLLKAEAAKARGEGGEHEH